MSNPFEAPALDGPARGHLPMVRWAAITLWVIAAFNGLTALSVPPLYALMGVVEDDMGLAGFMFVVGLFVAALVFAFGVLPPAAAAVGLRRGSKWAWFATVVVGGIYAPSACLPVGAFLLYAMLNDEVRRAFLDGPA